MFPPQIIIKACSQNLHQYLSVVSKINTIKYRSLIEIILLAFWY